MCSSMIPHLQVYWSSNCITDHLHEVYRIRLYRRPYLPNAIYRQEIAQEACSSMLMNVYSDASVIAPLDPWFFASQRVIVQSAQSRSPSRRNACYSMRKWFSSRWDRDEILQRAVRRARLRRHDRYMKGVLGQNTNLPNTVWVRTIHIRKWRPSSKCIWTKWPFIRLHDINTEYARSVPARLTHR